MGARAILLPAWLLAGCLSAPDSGGAGDDADPSPQDCEPVAFEEAFTGDTWYDDRWAESWDEYDMLSVERDRAVIYPTGVADQYAYFETSASYDVTDRCVHVEVPAMVNHGETVDSEALLGILLSDDNWVTVGQSQGLLCCGIEVGGMDGGDESCTVDYDPVEHRWWRLQVRKDGLTCEASADKRVWAVVGDLDFDFGSVTGVIDLYAGTWDTVEDPGQVEFDNLNL